MSRGLLFRTALAMLACAGIAKAANAQPFEMNVLNDGKPAPDVQVSAILNAVKTPVGTTNAAGQVTLDPSRLNLANGTQVTVWIKTCEDGTVELVLVPRGEEGDCVEEGAEVGEDCGCKRAGIFIVGDGPVTVDVGRGTVTQTSTTAGSTWTDFTFGAAFDLRQMLNLEDVVLQVPNATEASATSWAPGIQLLTDWNLTPWFSVGLDASYATMETEARFPAGVQTGDLDYYEVGGNAKLGFRIRQPIRPYATLGFSRAWNKADFVLDGETDHRVHKTGRGGIGAGLDWYPRSNVGVRLEATYSSTFEDDDADEHVRWKFGLLYRPFTTVRGGL